MIRTLKKKFILTAMIAVTVLLVLMLGGVNAVNAWSSYQEGTELLNLLTRMESSENRPDWRDGSPIPPPDESGNAPFPSEDPFSGFRQEPGGRGFMSQPLTEDDWRAAVYFTVKLQDGAVIDTDVSRISTISEEEAAAYGRRALASGKARGSLDHFRWACGAAEDGKTVYVFLDNSARRTSVLRVAALSALAGLAGWGLMLLLVLFLTKKALAPVAENMSRQRQFVTDAGHELKTPLAIIRANTEAMEMIQGQTKWSRNIADQAVRLSALTNELLTLARSEELPKTGDFEEVDFSELVSHSAELFREPMELRRMKLDAQIAPGLRLRGNSAQLSTLCSVLMDNAVKYGVEGGTIRLALAQNGKTARLQIENDCEQLPDCPPERLFDRFYRADTARNQKSGGFGIGLSAARLIAQQHRGTLEAEYRGEQRVAFTAELPV